MTLRPDGIFTTGGRLLASMTHNDSAGNLTGSSTADTGQSPDERGRWGASSGKFYLFWDDGSYAEYGYYVEGAPGGRKMLLKPADGKNELWEEVW